MATPGRILQPAESRARGGLEPTAPLVVTLGGDEGAVTGAVQRYRAERGRMLLRSR